MDVHDQLKQGNPLDANAMHLVTFLFQEDYVTTIAAHAEGVLSSP